MRILTVVGELDKGGTARGAYAFTRRFIELGGDSRFCFVYGGGARKRQIEEDGIKVIALADLEECLRADGWIPDIVHIHSHGLELESVVYLKRLYSSARFIETNIFSRVCEWESLLDTSYQLSRWGLNEYRKQKTTKRSSILRYPILDKEHFKPSSSKEVAAWKKKYGIRSSDVVIGRVGQAYSGKWSCHMISAFESICRAGIHIRLVIVNAPSSILQRVRVSPYRSLVISIDSIESDIELAKCYSSIDIFLHMAEQGESYGLVIQESLLCGTPVIALETPWADNAQKEHLSVGEGGFSVRTRKELIDKMLMLAVDRTLAKEMGASGREGLVERAADINEVMVIAECEVHAVEPSRKTSAAGRYLVRQRAAMLVKSLGFSATVSMACIGFIDVLWLKMKICSFISRDYVTR